MALAALASVSLVTDMPQTTRNHKVGGACRFDVEGASLGIEPQLKQCGKDG